MIRRYVNSGRALLLCNGEPPGRRLARQLARWCELLVAADGGANNAPALGVTPDVIIGDLDSVTPSTLRTFRDALVIHIRRQDNTDLEKALDFLQEQGFRKILLAGATGRRIDMTLANLTVLWRYVPFMEITIVGDNWHAVPVQGFRRMRARKGTLVSILPCGPCRGVTLRGLQYPLTNAQLGAGKVAVSNVVKSSPFGVTIRKGRALVVVQEPATPSSLLV